MLKPYNVLFVDDETRLTTLFKRILTREQPQYAVRTATSGKEALRRIEEETPDLIITDLNMPEMDGKQLFNTVQQNTKTPTVFLTAQASETNRKQFVQEGATAYLEKPINQQQLVNFTNWVHANHRTTTEGKQPRGNILFVGTPLRQRWHAFLTQDLDIQHAKSLEAAAMRLFTHPINNVVYEQTLPEAQKLLAMLAEHFPYTHITQLGRDSAPLETLLQQERTSPSPHESFQEQLGRRITAHATTTRDGELVDSIIQATNDNIAFRNHLLSNNKGHVYLVLGERGAGKDTLTLQTSLAYPTTTRISRHHTRYPRALEMNGDPLRFVNEETMHANKDHYLHVYRRGPYMVGIPQQPIQQALSEGYDVLLVLAEEREADDVTLKLGHLLTGTPHDVKRVLVHSDDDERLARAHNRGGVHEETRARATINESTFQDYDAVIVNNTVPHELKQPFEYNLPVHERLRSRSVVLGRLSQGSRT